MLGVAVKAVAVHILPDGAQQVFALLGDAAAQADDLRLQEVDRVDHHFGQLGGVFLCRVLSGLVALGRRVKAGAAVHLV